MNKADTKEYKESFAEATKRIKNSCTIQEAEICELDFGYLLERSDYLDKDNIAQGTKKRLMKDGKTIYEWFSLYDSLLNYVFEHSDGSLYFLHNKELYGYSIVKLSTLETMDYVPDTDEETFIWCKASYNPLNDLIAVEGCYWACPTTVILADFTEPLKAVEAAEWHEAQECFLIDKDYNFSHDISLIGWHKNSIDLKVNCYTGDLCKNNKNPNIKN